MQKHF
jgi:hypothetical protein